MDEIENIDGIDRNILQMLAENPRAPYSDIASKLKDDGYELTGEGVRYRVSKLLEITSTFFLLDPEDHNWQILRVIVTTKDGSDAKSAAFNRLSEMPFWLVCRGIGNVDVFAVGIIPSNKAIDVLLSDIRDLDSVKDVIHHIETERSTSVTDYLSAQFE